LKLFTVPRLALRRATVALGAAGALAAFGGAAQPASAMEVGVQDSPVFVFQTYYNRVAALQRSMAFGTNTLRIDMYWGDYKRYGFGPYDQAVKAAVQRHVRPQISLSGTPNYDPKGDPAIKWSNPNVRRYAGWVGLVARHYKGKVRRYSIWSEPNQCYFLSKSSCSYSKSAVSQRIAIYRTLYRAGYSSIKGNDRSAQVLIGELSPINDPLGFLSRVVSSPSYRIVSDGFALHPYELATHRRVTGISSTPRIKALLRSLAGSRKLRTPRGGTVGLYYTELGYVRGYGGIRTEAQRASKTVAGFRYAKRQGVRQVVYYHLVAPPSGFPRDPFPSAILTSTGAATTTYTALVRARRSF
jgi:hypothetical protein